MKLNALPFYLWLLRANLWGIILYRRYRRLPTPLISLLSKFGFNPTSKLISLQVQGLNHPILARARSSDVDVFYQIFVDEEYSFLEKSEDVNFVLDCGANVGYAAIYLLNKYPHARLIAVEPDEGNFQICRKNLAPYEDRVTLIRSGVWSHETGLIVCQAGDGREWSIQVRESQANEEPDLLATDINSLLQQSGFSSIDLLKMDVEGAEKVIFSRNYDSWLNKVKNIAIELHSQEDEQAFFNALSPYNYEVSRVGELTVCQEISPKLISVSS